LTHSTATLILSRAVVTTLTTATLLGVARTVTALRAPRTGGSFIEAQTHTVAAGRAAAVLIRFTAVTGIRADALAFRRHCVASQSTTTVTIRFAGARSDGTLGLDFSGLECLLLVDVSGHCSNQTGEHDNPHIVALIYRV